MTAVGGVGLSADGILNDRKVILTDGRPIDLDWSLG